MSVGASCSHIIGIFPVLPRGTEPTTENSKGPERRRRKYDNGRSRLVVGRVGKKSRNSIHSCLLLVRPSVYFVGLIELLLHVTLVLPYPA